MYRKKTIVAKVLDWDVVRYGIVGVFNTLLGLGLIFFFYYVVGLNYILSNVFTYTIGLIITFFFQDKWIFAGSDRVLKGKIFLFLTVFGVAFLTNLALLYGTVEFIGWHPNVGQPIGIMGYACVNYLGNKVLTFRKVKEGFKDGDTMPAGLCALSSSCIGRNDDKDH